MTEDEEKEFDAWLKDVNERLVESLDSAIDVEANLIALKQAAAKNAAIEEPR